MENEQHRKFWEYWLGKMDLKQTLINYMLDRYPILAWTTEGASQTVRQGEQLNDDGLVQLPDNAVTGGVTHRDKC